MMWIAEADTSDRYKLLVCVPRGTRLYVLVAGPGGLAESRPEPWYMTVTPAGGEPLPPRGLARSGGKSDSIAVGEFNDPPDSPVPLDIRMQVDDVEVFAAVAIPVRTELV